MSSELYGGSADRPERGDRPREGDASGRVDRDITPVPEYAGLGAEGISRDEAYAQAEGTAGTRDRRSDDPGGRGDDPGRGDSGREDADTPSGTGPEDRPGHDGPSPGDQRRAELPGTGEPARGPDEAAGPHLRYDTPRPAADGPLPPPNGPHGGGWDRGPAAPDSPEKTGPDDSPPRRDLKPVQDRPAETSDQAATARTDEGAGKRPRPADSDDPSENRERVQPLEKTPETQDSSPDQNPDEQRWTAMEQRMQSALDGIKADYEARFDSLKAEHKAETDSIKADYEARISELEDKVEGVQQEKRTASDRTSERDEGPEPSGTADTIASKEHQETPRSDNAPRDIDYQADKADIEGCETAWSDKGDRQTEPARRYIFSAENVGAAGAGIAFGQSAVEIFRSVPPEVGFGAAAVGFLGAMLATPFLKRTIEKWKGRDER